MFKGRYTTAICLALFIAIFVGLCTVGGAIRNPSFENSQYWLDDSETDCRRINKFDETSEGRKMGITDGDWAYWVRVDTWEDHRPHIVYQYDVDLSGVNAIIFDWTACDEHHSGGAFVQLTFGSDVLWEHDIWEGTSEYDYQVHEDEIVDVSDINGADRLLLYVDTTNDWAEVIFDNFRTENGSTEPIIVDYIDFKGNKHVRYAWAGKKVAFLTESADLDVEVMQRLCRTFDDVYDYYTMTTGRTPTQLPNTTIEGRMTIAEVQDTCGAGCAYLGAQGIELMPYIFQMLYNGVENKNQYDQVLFYEFGRNFWFYEDQIEYKNADDTGTVTTGYAVFMRFLAADAVSIQGGPFRDRSWDEFRDEVERMVDYYMDDPRLNWHNTLQIGEAPNNPMGLGATDLFASFLFKLYHKYGGHSFIQRLWREVDGLPLASTTQEAVDNFIHACSIAAGEDLTAQFLTWRWPVSSNGAPPPAGKTHTYGATAGWYMVSVPLNSGTASDLFGTTAYCWNPATGQYNMPTIIEPTKGYWANLSSSRMVTDSGSEIATDVAIDISTAGWHQISTPWPYPKDSIQVAKAGLTKSWNAAMAAGWVCDQIYGYKATDGNYTTPSTLDPWYGYWMRADASGLSLKLLYASRTSVIPPPPPPAFAPTDLPAPPSMLPETPPTEADLVFTNIPNPITDVHTTTFVVTGPMAVFVEAINVQIFDLSGRLVYESGEISGASLDWHTENDYGETLANGVYLYRMYALIGGKWVESEVKKLAILR